MFSVFNNENQSISIIVGLSSLIKSWVTKFNYYILEN